MRTSMRLVLPLAQVAVAIALRTHTYLGPDTWENPAGLGPDNQFCDALNAPATMIRQCLLWIVPRLECLLLVPARFRSDITPETICCWGYLSHPVNLAMGTVVYFGLVWLVWYAAILEAGGGGRSVLTPKSRMRIAADVFGIVFGLGLVALGLEVRGTHFPRVYWNIVAVPYYMWGVLVAIFYGRDLRLALRDPQKGPTATLIG